MSAYDSKRLFDKCKKDITLLKDIDNPSMALQLAMVKHDPESYFYISNPYRHIEYLAVESNLEFIFHIPNPYPNNLIKFLGDYPGLIKDYPYQIPHELKLQMIKRKPIIMYGFLYEHNKVKHEVTQEMIKTAFRYRPSLLFNISNSPYVYKQLNADVLLACMKSDWTKDMYTHIVNEIYHNELLIDSEKDNLYNEFNHKVKKLKMEYTLK